MAEERKIKVEHEGQELVLNVKQGKLSIKTLQQFYPRATGLTYKISNEVHAVHFVNENEMEIDGGVSNYQVFIPKAPLQSICEAKRRRLNDMLKDIGCARKVLADDAEKGETDERVKRIKNKTRILIVSWKHRSSNHDKFKSMSPLAPQMKIEIYFNEEYTVASLTSVILQSFVKPSIKTFFESSEINLGYGNDIVLYEFIDEKEAKCSFWDFCKRIRDIGHRLKILLLTTSRESSIQDLKQNENLNSLNAKPSSKLGLLVTNDKSLSQLNNLNKSESADFNINNYPSCSWLKVDTRSVFKKPEKRSEEKIKHLDLHIEVIDEKELQMSEIILGKGAQGVVRKATWRGSEVAVKSINKTKLKDKLTFREMKMLEKIRHKNFINLYGIATSPTSYHIIMELFHGTNLNDLLFQHQKDFILNLSKKNTIGYEVSKGMNFIHSEKYPIIHRDIKPSNILINKFCQIKICDLGLSKSADLDPHLLTSIDGVVRGTPLFMAPELLVLEKEPSTMTDVWATACTFVEMYSEESVWNVKGWNFCHQLKNMLKAKKIPNLDSIPQFLRITIAKCFNYAPEARATMSDVLQTFAKEELKSPKSFYSF